MAQQSTQGEEKQAPNQCPAPMWIGPSVFLALVAVAIVAYLLVRLM